MIKQGFVGGHLKTITIGEIVDTKEASEKTISKDLTKNPIRGVKVFAVASTAENNRRIEELNSL